MSEPTNSTRLRSATARPVATPRPKREAETGTVTPTLRPADVEIIRKARHPKESASPSTEQAVEVCTDERVKIPASDGVLLDALCTRTTRRLRPSNASCAKHAVIFVPSLGATSNLAELVAVSRRLSSRGYVFVRFDMRGTGKSEGRSSMGEPLAEVLDVQSVAQWARRRYPSVEKVWAVGVSYGAVLAAAAAGRFDEVDGYCAISYPTDFVWFLTAMNTRRWQGHASTSKPKLFVWGTSDVYASMSSSIHWYKSLESPKHIVLFRNLDPNRGHLFHTKPLLSSLADHVEWWLAGARDSKSKKPPPSPKKKKNPEEEAEEYSTNPETTTDWWGDALRPITGVFDAISLCASPANMDLYHDDDEGAGEPSDDDNDDNDEQPESPKAPMVPRADRAASLKRRQPPHAAAGRP